MVVISAVLLVLLAAASVAATHLYRDLQLEDRSMRAHVSRVNNAPKKVRGRPFERGNPGRPKGSRNKVTQAMLLSAREAFAPMTELAIERGTKHLNDCGKVGWATCRHYEAIANAYAYDRPTQPLDIDSSALRQELEKLAELSGKSVDEVEREAELAGLLLFRHRGAS